MSGHKSLGSPQVISGNVTLRTSAMCLRATVEGSAQVNANFSFNRKSYLGEVLRIY